MGFPFRGATIRAFVHATEDERRVMAALGAVLPDWAQVQREELSGYHGNPIISLKAEVRRPAQLRELWRRAVKKLREGELEKLRRTIDDRVDETCHFYLRFDKQAAYAGELLLTSGGDAIHVKLKVAAYPARRKAAIKIVQDFIAETPQRG